MSYGDDNYVGNKFIDNTIAPTGTLLYLLSGVPLDDTNDNQLWFEQPIDQQNYFLHNSKFNPIVVPADQYSYQRTQATLRIGINAEQLYKYNYIAFQNDQYGSHWFYGFVTDVEYVSEAASNVTFKIDVLQTWLFDINFHPSLVKQMHDKEFNSSGNPIARNYDEGMNYGTDYNIVDQIHITDEPNPYIRWIIILTTYPFERENYTKYAPTTSFNGVMTPLYAYTMPVDLRDPYALQSKMYKDPKGGNIIIPPFGIIANAITKSEDMAGKVVSMEIVDWKPAGITGSYPNYTFTGAGKTYPVWVSDFQDMGVGDGTAAGAAGLIRLEQIPLDKFQEYDIANVYDHFTRFPTSKLMNSPYAMIELTDFKGHMQMLKPEYLPNGKLTIRVHQSVSWNTKVSYTAANYNDDGTNPYHSWYPQGVPALNVPMQNWDSTITDFNSGDIPIATDALAAYLQSNRNSLRTQMTNAEASGYTAMANSIDSGVTNTLVGAIQGMQAGLGPMGVNVLGGAVGAITGSGTAAMQGMSNYRNTSRSVGTNIANLARTQQAKMADIKNLPENISGMGNNTIFEANNLICGCYLVFKQLKDEYAESLGSYFNLYGYKANRLVDLSAPRQCFHSRRCWNYVQTVDAKITGNINTNAMSEIKGIFNKGVTLWHPESGVTVGDYGANNSEL